MIKFTEKEMEVYRQHGVDEGWRKGIGFMCIIFIPITLFFMVVVNSLIKLI